MKKITFKIFEAIIIICFVLFLYGMLRSHPPTLTFGYGIADWLFVLLYSALFIIQIIAARYGLRNNRWFVFLIMFGFLIVAFILLNMTIWRGEACPLEEGFFYR